MKTNTPFWSYLAHFFVDWEMFQTKFVDEIKTHIFLLNNFFFFENHAVCEKTWKNVVESDRQQVAMWRMRFALWIPKTKYTHSEYVMLIAFPLQQRLHERAVMLRYTYIACIVIIQYIK